MQTDEDPNSGAPAIGPHEAADRHAEGVPFLDVREPAEFEAGHVPGARHVPLGDIEGSLAGLPPDRQIVVVCRSGRRSAHATLLLLRSGLDAVNLEGGLQAWEAAGFVLETLAGRPGRVE